MKILVLTYSETGNTDKVAGAIRESLAALEHEVDEVSLAGADQLDGIGLDSLNAYDLVFVGSACHDTDLAMPVKQLLADLPSLPRFSLAGFVTHATVLVEDDDSPQHGFAVWAAKCARSFQEASRKKGVDLLGYFSCQGAPSKAIETFIHEHILPGEAEWQEYIQEARKHPDEEDLQQARAFARQVLSRC